MSLASLPSSINNRKLFLFLAVTMTLRTVEIPNDQKNC